MSKKYDDIPYFSSAFSFSAPTHLYACARLVGLEPTPPSRAKVLEIGCSFGGNLIPYAVHFLNAKFIGIDLSKEQINSGKKIVEQMGLKNIELIAQNIADLTPDSFGGEKFDYIIAHGVYSWVPDSVRTAILRTIKEHLALNGVAYLSFNAYPGWHISDILRHVMLKARKANPDDGLLFIKQTLSKYEEFLLLAKANNAMPLCPIDSLLYMLNRIKGSEEFYLEHDYLEADNRPFYFDDFCEDLRQNSLSYLIDAHLHDATKPGTGYEPVDEFVEANFDSIGLKKDMFDTLNFTNFNKSLIVHETTRNRIKDKTLDINDFACLNLIANFKKGDDGRYYFSDGTQMDMRYEFIYSIFEQMYPNSVSLSQIFTILSNNNLDAEELANSAFMGFLEVLKLDRVLISPTGMQNIIYEKNRARLKPEVVGYLRYFASTPKPNISFANMLGQNADITPLFAAVALKFDGSKTHDEIAKSTIKWLNDNGGAVEFGGEILLADKQESFVREYVAEVSSRLSELYFLERI